MRTGLTFLCLLAVLSACGQAAIATQIPETPVPYLTATPTLTPTVFPALTEVLLPTATTFTYSVVQGDTLIGIAQRNGVTLEALMAANPGISPTSLSIGTKLIIPAGSQVTGEPTLTPAAAPVQQARCWPESTGGLWCFGLIRNEYALALENVSAQFTLLDANGQVITSQEVYGLLDIIPAGESEPLAAHFAPPVQGFTSLRVQVLTAMQVLAGDARYLPIELENTLVVVDSTGLTAQVSGQARLTSAGTTNTLWLLAAAYDSAGELIGVRRWQADSALSSQTPLEFKFMVSSLGPSIDKVNILAEARP